MFHIKRRASRLTCSCKWTWAAVGWEATVYHPIRSRDGNTCLSARNTQRNQIHVGVSSTRLEAPTRRTLLLASSEESLVDLYPYSFSQSKIASGPRGRGYIERIDDFHIPTILRPKKCADDLKKFRGNSQQSCSKTRRYSRRLCT